MLYTCVVTLLMGISLPDLPGLGGDGRAFRKADEMFLRGNVDQAVEMFQVFVTEHPKSKYVPEARYKRACLLVFQGKMKESVTAHRELIRQHPETIWSDMSLNCHLSEELVGQMGDLAYDVARNADDPQLYEWPAKLYGVVMTRNPKAYSARYRHGVCLTQASRLDEGNKVLTALAEESAAKQYAKLAAARSKPTQQAPQALDELMEDTSGQKEEWLHVVVDLAGPYVRKFPTATEVPKCRRKLADAWRCLGRPEKAIGHYRKLLDAGPDADTLFWLAECLWRSEGTQATTPCYDEFVEKYSGDPRAFAVKRWRKWLDGHAEASEVLEKSLERLGELLADGRFESLKFSVVVDSKGAGRVMRADARFAEDGRMMVDLHTTEGGLTWAQNPTGLWLHFTGSSVAIHSIRKDLYARPSITLSPVEGSDKMNFGMAMAMGRRDEKKEMLDIPPEAPAYLFKKLAKMGLHLRVTDRDGGKQLTIQLIPREGRRVTEMQCDLDEKLTPVAFRLATGEGGERLVFDVTRLAINEKVGEEDFKFPMKPEWRIRDVHEINPFSLLNRIMRLLYKSMPSLRRGENRAASGL